MNQWKGQTRGGITGYRIFVFFIRTFGLSFSYFFLKIVAVYFLFSSGEAHKASYNYYRHGLKLGKIKAYFKVYSNYVAFGKVLVDRIAVLSGFVKRYTYDFDGEHHLRKMVEDKTGGILVNAHVGNWEIAGQLLERLNTRINVLMFDAEHEKIKQYMSGVLVNKNVNIIVIKDGISHLEKIKEALENKEIIAMNGDRFFEGNKVISCPFLGKEALFPVGPFYMAGKYKVPVTYAFAMKESKTHYHFYATPPRWIENFNQLKERDNSLKQVVTEYAAELERIVKRYPNQWFNFYDFWRHTR
jgi:predicted LPLAT superfamily acyltransferase